MTPPPASHELAAEIRSALNVPGKLTIQDWATRWPSHFRDGALVVEIYDANGFHDWPGLTDVGLLALDVLDADPSVGRPWGAPRVPVALDAIDSAATSSSSTQPNTPTTPHVGKQTTQ